MSENNPLFSFRNISLSTAVKRNDTSFLNEDPFKPNLFKNPYGDRDEL